MTLGYIDRCVDGVIDGWLIGSTSASRPYIVVNGVPVPQVEVGIPRPDVVETVGLEGNFGFKAYLSHSVQGTAELMLYEAGVDRLEPVSRHTLDIAHTAGLSPLDLQAAIDISRQPDSVAIVVWDAAHNPAGRAKVLYDIVTQRRPAVVFGFCHPEFGSGLWPPLRSTGIHAYLVRPSDFRRFQRQMRLAEVTFDTIWMCKPRLPTFLLAEALSHPETAFVLDIDDNEEAFSRSTASRGKWFGEESINKASLYLERYRVRSVASASLQAHFGGRIVRHGRLPVDGHSLMPSEYVSSAADFAVTRQEADEPEVACKDGSLDRWREETIPAKIDIPFNKECTDVMDVKSDEGRPFRLVFVGTVHAHKGLVEAARAVRLAGIRSGYRIKLAVGGTFHPPHIEVELAAEGVEVLGPVTASELHARLASFDAVLTGFPNSPEFDEINRFQISSKISDALSVGLPALVPKTDAVADLAEVPGVYLFETHNFAGRLLEVMDPDRPRPGLPQSFDIRHQYETFVLLESEARQASSGPRGLHRRRSNVVPPPPRKKVLMVWKQGDSGVYGRRVDQAAAALALDPDMFEVTVVELLSHGQIASLSKDHRMISDNPLLREAAIRKINGYQLNGVSYRSILYSDDPPPSIDLAASGAFASFLDANGFTPDTTVLIIFPVLGTFDAIRRDLSRFRTVVDVVDNQVSWSRNAEERVRRILQYRALSDTAHHVIFNSSENMRYMIDRGLVDAGKSTVIPNWYLLPSENQAAVVSRWSSLEFLGDKVNVLYSGNMNDRIDWDLLEQAAGEIRAGGGLLHLVGASTRADDALRRVLRNRSCIYHGPLPERELQRLAARCDFALVPHLRDAISSYMNPLKVKMYEAIGLPHIVSAVLGVDEGGEWTTITRDHGTFLDAVRQFLSEANREHRSCEFRSKQALPPEAHAYRELVVACFGE